MKKAAILVISILFFGSIALIGVKGGSIINPPDKVIVKVTEIGFDLEEMARQEGITIESVNVNELGETVVFAARDFVGSYIQIIFNVLPVDASNKVLDLIETDKPDSVTVDGDAKSPTFGRLTFAQPLGERVRTRLIFSTTDGTEKTKTIIFHVK